MTSTTTRLTTYAAAAATTLAILAPTTAVAGSGRAAADTCRPGAPTVASKTLRTAAGRVLGKARLTIETVDGTTIVCGIVEVRKPFRTHSTLVTLDLRERSKDGADLGQAKAVERATRLSPPTMTSSFVPSGSTFVFRGKIDIGAIAKGKATYLVP